MKKTTTIFLVGLTLSTAMAQLITPTGDMSVQRMGHSSQLLGNGKVLTLGGNNGNYLSKVVYNTAELYNPALGTWAATGSMKKKRDYVASALLPNGNVLAIGGDFDVYKNQTASCEIYDVTAGTWSYTDSLPDARSNIKAIVLNNGKVLAVGGNSVTNCSLYDPATNKWTATGSLNTALRNGSVVKLPNGDVFATTGYMADKTEIYSVTTGTWSTVTNSMLSDHLFCSIILMSNGNVLIAGGTTSEVFNPVNNTFSAAGNLLQSVARDPMINLSNGKVLIYGTGDLFSIDRQSLQVFNPVANKWYSAGTVNVTYTADGYTVAKLQTGKILYVGGNASTGNGSYKYCYLVNESSIAVGINDLLTNYSINVSPNPFTTAAVIQINSDMKIKNARLKLFDLIGNEIRSLENIDENQIKIERENMTSGIYLYKLTEGNEIIAAGKLIVE